MNREVGFSEAICPKTQVKHKISDVLGQRILRFTSAKAPNLTDKIVGPEEISSLTPTLTAGSAQSSLGQFSDGEIGSPDEIYSPDVGAPSGSSGQDGSSSESEENVEESLIGLIYARVSSEKQRDGNVVDDDNDGDDVEYDEGSIEGQIEEMREIAERNDIELPYDPITDEAKTGANFERDGIQRVFEIAKREDIDYLLVEKVDRIGRNAPETLYFIYVLQSECGVTLITNSGESDISETDGLMHTTLMSLLAEVQNELRVAKAKKERIRGFLKKKNWNCRSPKIPIGYEEDDDGWLVVNTDEKRIVRDMFQKFAECETYAETERYIDAKYGPEVLDGHKLKTILQNWVYIGKPRVPEEWLNDSTYENDLLDPKLHLLREDDNSPIDVSEDTFHEVQEIIERKNKNHDYGGGKGLMDFIEEFSLFSVIQGTEPAKLIHHCGEPLVKDGQFDLKGQTIHRYKCKKCEEEVEPSEYYRRWPKEHELDAMEIINKVVEGGKSLFDNEE